MCKEHTVKALNNVGDLKKVTFQLFFFTFKQFKSDLFWAQGEVYKTPIKSI